MNSEAKTRDGATAVIDEVSKWGVGLGILTFALFPLSIPLLVLTAAALVPLAIPVLVIGLLAIPFLLVRRLVAKLRAWTARRRSAGPIGPSTTATSTPSSSESILRSTGPMPGRGDGLSVGTPFATTGGVSSARSRAASSRSHSPRSPMAH
jgi:hypothetical protein